MNKEKLEKVMAFYNKLSDEWRVCSDPEERSRYEARMDTVLGNLLLFGYKGHCRERYGHLTAILPVGHDAEGDTK